MRRGLIKLNLKNLYHLQSELTFCSSFDFYLKVGSYLFWSVLMLQYFFWWLIYPVIYFREVELEQVLTTYTKINKSAAIFLGSSKTETDTSAVKNTTAAASRPSSSQKPAANMHGIIVNGTEGE